jgi:hypothetical protein
LKIDLTAQADIKRRDIAFNKEVCKDVRKTMTITSIYFRPTLSSIILSIVKEKEVRPVIIIDISGLAFSLNIYRQSNTIFTTSLYEIDRILEGRREDDEELL